MASNVQVFPEFITQARKYVLINSDSRGFMHKAGGVPVRVPAKDEVLSVDKENPTGFFSATDMDGSYIPGTVVVQDRFRADLEGNEVLTVDAALIVRSLLGINNKQGMATGILASRGLSLLPAGTSREGLEEIREAGSKRSEKWRVEQARFIVAEFDNANAKRRKHNVPELTPDDDYTQSLLLLRASRGKDQARLAAMLSGPDVTGDATLMEHIKADVDVDEVDEIMELLKQKARQVVPDNAPPADIQKLVQIVLDSPEGMKIIRKQYKMQRHARAQKKAQNKEEQITDQDVLEKMHGRPRPVHVEKTEAPLSAADKEALLDDAKEKADKGALLERMAPTE